MVKQKNKQITEAQRVRKMLKERGFTPITDEDKKKPWYKSYAESIERWRREELGKPFTVKEREALYSTKQTKSAKTKV